jgi:adenine-specific DNA methylase
MIKEIKQKKQDLGIFYTDQRIADFIFDILKIWKDKEEKEFGRWESRKYFPSVVDPAVGEGVFLKAALEQNFTTPKYVFGVDIDEEVKKKWVEINLLKSFGSKAELDNHFYHQNGLVPLDENKVFRHKKGGLKEFDAVVGNPPYGGIGVDFQGTLTFENRKLLDALEKFEIFGFRKYSQKSNKEKEAIKAGLFDSLKEKSPISYRLSITEVSKIAERIPIEILFIERFIQLAKPGGWIAIIIPDGILTNSNSHYVREFISEKTRVEAIVSLPRDAFKNVGTTAKTSILFLRKYKNQEKKQDNYSVFLASVDSLDGKNFNFIKDTYQKYYNKTMSNKNLIQTTTDEKGREIVMVRVDKTLKKMMEEKPASRWDPAYWHPKYDEVINGDPLGSFISSGPEGITYGAIITGKKNKHISDGIPVVGAEQIRLTGLDLLECERTKKNSPWDPERSRVYTNDLVFVRSGVGSLGKSIVYLGKEYINVGCFVDRIKLKDLSPFYVDIYLKSPQGKLQIERLNAGVTGTTNISFDQIKSIKIPTISVAVQKNIESEYKKMSKYHDKAMEAKKNDDETEYKKSIETAEKMLKDLIAKTEAVIRGERKDVI